MATSRSFGMHGFATSILFSVVSLAVTAAPSAASGSLKVTSFPSGAAVWVDGSSTGKVTPMSISLSEGDHTVTVKISNSAWNADTRTVTIVTGNNDLSVTLLPILTTGPQGIQGEKGDKGDRGETGAQGVPGNLALGGQMCSAGTFVAGFSLSGQIICDGSGGTGPFPSPIVLPQGQLIEDYLRALTGTESNASLPFQGSVPNVGSASGVLSLIGFALCEPPDPLAAPSLSPPAYACTPDVHVSFVANSTSRATLTLDVPHVFAGLAGSWDLETILVAPSGKITGFGGIAGAQLVFSVPLVDAENGLKSFGQAMLISFTTQATTLALDFHNSLLNAVVGLLEGFAEHKIFEQMAQVARTTVSTALAGMPPFALQ